MNPEINFILRIHEASPESFTSGQESVLFALQNQMNFKYFCISTFNKNFNCSEAHVVVVVYQIW